MTLFNDKIKLASRAGETKKPRQHFKTVQRIAKRFKVGRTFRQQLIRLEKQTSTHYKKRVREISNYNNRSRGAGGVWAEYFYP